jgi:soluble lytic murein transglycosylase-like protein
MLRSLAFILVLTGAIFAPSETAFAQSSSLGDYMALRKKNSIVRPSPVTALDAVSSPRILELRCTIKGIMELDGKSSLYIEYPNGGEQVVDAEKIPDWLKNGPVLARLLVRASRETEYSAVKVEFVAAANDSDVWKFDAVDTKPVATKKNTAPSTFNMTGPIGGRSAGRSSTPTASRGSSRVSRGMAAPNKEILNKYASFISNHNKKLGFTRASEIANAVLQYSMHYDVDPRLVIALLIAESDFDPTCTSHTGAKGLGQLMPETARELGVRNPYDNIENLYGTVKLLKQHLDRYQGSGDEVRQISLALAAYNAGPGAVKKHGGIPPYRETQNYVRKIISLYRQLTGKG